MASSDCSLYPNSKELVEAEAEILAYDMTIKDIDELEMENEDSTSASFETQCEEQEWLMAREEKLFEASQ